MKKIKLLFRLFYINFILVKFGLDQIVLSIPFFAPIRFIAYLNPWNWFNRKSRTRGERLRLALETLGPIFVKFGQTLSTRGDLFPEDIVAELSKLQDDVPPFSSDIAIRLIEKAYDAKVSDVFETFEFTPKASASIAQVHEVTTKEGKHAIVKVLRPGIEKIIKRDLDILYVFARLAERYWSEGPRLHPVEVIKEFDKIIHDELDLMREAANASQLRRNFADSDSLYVPEIYWPYARKSVLVMEYIHGIPISDIDSLKRHHINLKKLSERGVEIFFTQVFRDSYFHADMHPGNIFVDPATPEDAQYIAVDFGIMGTLSPDDQRYLALNMFAFFHRDYRKVAELHVESGWVPADTRIDEFESAIRTVCEPIFEKPLKEISFGRTLMRLFQTGRRFHMEVQPQLVLLQKTLLHIEGLGRKLDPDLDLWVTAKPYLEEWMKKQVGPKAFINKMMEHGPEWMNKLPEMPELAYETFQAVREFSRFSIQHSNQDSSCAQKCGAYPISGNTKRGFSKRRRWPSIFLGLGFGFAITALIQYFLISSAHLNIAQWHMIAGFGLSAIVALAISGLLS